MEGLRQPNKAVPVWSLPEWQDTWATTAGIVEAILSEEIPELAKIQDDDPLGSAKLYLQNPTPESWQYMVDDIRTAVFEALVKRGHLSVTTSKQNEPGKSFGIGPTSIRDISIRGLANPNLNKAEFNRRIIELQTELFLEQASLSPEDALLWISPFAHDMLPGQAKGLGYFIEEKTYMIRWIEIEPDGTRVTQQLSMRGSNLQRLSNLLVNLGVNEAQEGFSSTGVLMTPLVVKRRDFPSGPVDVARMLDGQGEFLGGDLQDYTYEEIGEISRRREQMLEELYPDFCNHLLSLVRAETNQLLTAHEAKQSYKEALYNLILTLASQNPEMAREAIGERSADLFRLANLAEQNGNQAEANTYRTKAAAESNPIYVCGMSLEFAKNNVMPEKLLGGQVCKEFRIGQIVVCPCCRTKQVVLPQNLTSERLYCSNNNCDLARVGRRKRSKPKRPGRKLSLLEEIFGHVKPQTKKPNLASLANRR